MKKFKGTIRKVLSAALTAGLIITAAAPAAVQADGRRVVTLGADLNDAQINSILKYFGVQGKNVETIYVTNQNERDMLGNYMPLEQIGRRTISCAYVQPTTSGGIHVKTANLNYVTSNMIASALSTSGVKNCDVIAAAPFEVSGTGALTGVMMAYEVAAGNVLTESRKQAASQEIVTTGMVAQSVGQAQATKIVNDIKIKIIEQGVTADDEIRIREIVEDTVNEVMSGLVTDEDVEMNELSDEDLEVLDELASTIAEQGYDIEDMRETLERVEQNVMNEIGGESEIATLEGEEEFGEDLLNNEAEGENETVLGEDSILMNTDDTALGENVIIDATNEEALQTIETLEGDENFDDTEEFEIVTQEQNTFDDNADANGDEEQLEELGQNEAFDDTETFEGEEGFEELNENEAGADEFEEGLEEFGEEGLGELGEEDMGEAPSDGAAPEATFAPNGGTPSFGAFSMKLYVNGKYKPASGTLTLYDSAGDEAESIDLEDSSKWGVRSASDAGVSVPGYSDANEIQIFTSDLSLFDSSYRVSGDIVFADENGSETAPVHVESDFSFTDSLVYVSDDSATGFKAESYVTVSASIPEEASYAEIHSSDTGVAYIDDGHAEGDFASVGAMLAAKGDVTFTAEYFDDGGNSIGSDSITITVF